MTRKHTHNAISKKKIYKKKWDKENQDKIKQWRDDNKEEVSKYKKKWDKENQEKIREYERKYRNKAASKEPGCTYQIKNSINNKYVMLRSGNKDSVDLINNDELSNN